MAKDIDVNLFEKIVDKVFYNNKELKIRENSQGYQYVTINKKSCRLHRIIALKYIPNLDPSNLIIVDHKDGCKTNNNVDNLQWISYSDNSRKAYNNNESMKKMHTHKSGTRKIISEKDGVITEHDSLRKCGTFLGRDVAAVHRCLQGEWTRCNGHKLYYIYV